MIGDDTRAFELSLHSVQLAHRPYNHVLVHQVVFVRSLHALFWLLAQSLPEAFWCEGANEITTLDGPS